MKVNARRALMMTSVDTWTLGAAVGTVMALRMARIAAGGLTGAKEAELMVTEKVGAAIELQILLLTGALGTNPFEAVQGTLEYYRNKVAANHRRLTRY